MRDPKHLHAARWLVPTLFVVAGFFTILLVRNSASSLVEYAVPIPAWAYLLFFLIAVIVLTFLRKRTRTRVLWEALFTTAIFLGIWYVFLLLRLPFGVSLLIASFITVLHIFIHVALFHDVFFLLGSIGAAVIFAGWLPAEVLLVILVGFTVYDMVAGPPGGPVQHLASLLASLGFIPGFAFPEKGSDIFQDLDAIGSGNWVLLGTGDVVLPLALVASASGWNIASGVVVTLGMLLGALFLIARRDLHPRAALPGLSAGAAVPFLILLFVHAFLGVV
ncbi:MAG: hypothetical protein NUV81_02525 [bacterium]|nr:hypothetical protein [bacterium]